MARDWRFSPASFRGATFYVDSGSPSGGRRLAIHEYPGSEQWDVEDLGSKVKRRTITAYFVSETADADYAALVAACDQAGPGELLLPFFGAIQASAETWEPRWSQEKLNYVGGDFCFVEQNPAGAPVALGLAERIIAGMLSDASSLLGGAVAAIFAGVPATSYQRSDAAVFLGDASAFVETVRQQVALPDETSAAAKTAMANLGPTASIAADIDPGAFVATTLDTLDAIVIDVDPDEAVTTIQTAAALAITLVPSGASAPTGQPDASQAAVAIPVAIAIAATMQAIRLTAAATYVDRPSAIAARSAIQSMAVAVLPIVGTLGADVTTAFSDLWGQGVASLTQAITNLAPVVLFQTNLSLPSTALAYRLYGDPARASELVARNRVATPLLMPTLFEAASR